MNEFRKDIYEGPIQLLNLKNTDFDFIEVDAGSAVIPFTPENIESIENLVRKYGVFGFNITPDEFLYPADKNRIVGDRYKDVIDILHEKYIIIDEHVILYIPSTDNEAIQRFLQIYSKGVPPRIVLYKKITKDLEMTEHPLLRNIITENGDIDIKAAALFTPENYRDTEENIEFFTMAILSNMVLPKSFISRYFSKLDIGMVLSNNNLPEDFLFSHIHLLIDKILLEMENRDGQNEYPILDTLFEQNLSSEFYTKLVASIAIYAEIDLDKYREGFAHLSVLVNKNPARFPIELILENVTNGLFSLLEVKMRRDDIDVSFLKNNIDLIEYEELYFWLNQFLEIPEEMQRAPYTRENESMLKDVLWYKIDAER